MPITNTTLEALIQVVEPENMKTIPFQIAVCTHQASLLDKDKTSEEHLKNAISEYYKPYKIKVGNIELVECDILSPKGFQNVGPGKLSSNG